MAQENKVMIPQEWFDKHGPKGEDSITASELASSYAKYYHSEMNKIFFSHIKDDFIRECNSLDSPLPSYLMKIKGYDAEEIISFFADYEQHKKE